ncbi:MAG: hypothetical protein IPM61_10105 [Chlorobi bacterium]|nr:hypothetical protein [Chlorobiota bacterium]
MTARVSKDRHTSPSLLRRLKFWLLNLLFGRQQGLPLLRPEQLRRVLLLRHDRLGDAIITTPLIDALRHLNPAVQIDVIAAPANREFFQNDPRIGVVEVLQGSPLQRLGLILRCRRRRYDAGLQLVLGRTTLPAILLWPVPPHRADAWDAGPAPRTVVQPQHPHPQRTPF